MQIYCISVMDATADRIRQSFSTDASTEIASTRSARPEAGTPVEGDSPQPVVASATGPQSPSLPETAVDPGSGGV